MVQQVIQFLCFIFPCEFRCIFLSLSKCFSVVDKVIKCFLFVWFSIELGSESQKCRQQQQLEFDRKLKQKQQ